METETDSVEGQNALACTSCTSDQGGLQMAPHWRRALWIALAINATMFGVEIAAGIAGGSRALQADALDFMGDAGNYAISLSVAGLALFWRARAAFVKGLTLSLLGAYILVSTLWAVWYGGLPHAEIMGAVGIAALVANGFVAFLLYRFRTGDSNMRSVWICARNDVIGNAAVVLAAIGVFGSGTAWPDLLVAGVMAALGLWGGYQITRQALAEMTVPRVSPLRRSIS
jgi:Co/Zn/Cd efflux system component